MTTETILSFDKFQEYLKTVKVIARYDAACETKTPHPWWELDKATIHNLLKEISETVASCTKGATCLDRELQHVVNTATKLEQVERGSTMKVALIGAQGAGKSLLINALFDCTGLSLTGAKGFACTSAIVKYAYGPGKNVSAEVRFLNAQMREKMVDEHIRSYLDYHNDLEDTDDEDGGHRTRSFKQDEVDRKRKKTAEDFFDTIFGSRDEFLSAWSSSPVNTGEFKSLCQLKCTEAMEEYDMTSQGTIHFSKPTPAELLGEIKPFLSDVDGRVCLWPIVDCVTIRINNPVLLGVEIIDLPGSGDVNMLRARHADDVKDGVDVEIVLGDTVRIGTDDVVMSTVRAGVINHGSSRVKVVATKIDVVSDDQLAQCTGGIYDELNQLTTRADEDVITAEETGEDAKVAQINRYKLYLQRSKKAHMIRDRAAEISDKLGATLEGLSSDGAVDIIHTSTSDYMNWIKSDRILFNNQPALSPEETGVPTIRRFLFNLPASQNFRDYNNHINFAVPAFVDKLKRVVTQSDRDAGFRTIADDFDNLRSRFLRDMVAQLKWCYQNYVHISIKRVKRDASVYQSTLEKRIKSRWLTLRSPAFTRIVKSRGTVPQGTSKAKGLENAVNWNLDLAKIMKPGFQNWHSSHTENLKLLKDALPLQLDRLYQETVALMNRSQANLITVEKAKLKWVSYRLRMQSKLTALMDEMMAEENRFLNRSTLKDERENNLITTLTDAIYDDVFMSFPDLKVNPTPPGKPKRYKTPILPFRKARLEAHFLAEDAHFVDRLIALFQDQLQTKMFGHIDKHFTKFDAMFDDFSKLLRDHAPVDFSIDPRGEAIRTELGKHIEFIEEKSGALRTLLPVDLTQEDESLLANEDSFDDAEGKIPDLEYYLEKVSKKKRGTKEASNATSMRDVEPKLKRIKHETP